MMMPTHLTHRLALLTTLGVGVAALGCARDCDLQLTQDAPAPREEPAPPVAPPLPAFVDVTHDADGAIAYAPVERPPVGLATKGGRFLAGVTFEFKGQEFFLIATQDDRVHFELWRRNEDASYQRAAYSNQSIRQPCPGAENEFSVTATVWSTEAMDNDPIGGANRVIMEARLKKLRKEQLEIEAQLSGNLDAGERQELEARLTEIVRERSQERQRALTLPFPFAPLFFLGVIVRCQSPYLEESPHEAVMLYELKYAPEGSSSGSSLVFDTGLRGSLTPSSHPEVEPHVAPIERAITELFEDD